jgi:hypothetical protein
MPRIATIVQLATLAVLAIFSAIGYAAEGITFDEAKTLVTTVNEVALEFARNSTCSVENTQPAGGKFCPYYMLYASCTPKKGDPGLWRNFAVNKQNGDVEPIDQGVPARIEEPGLETVRKVILNRHGITSDEATAAQDLSMQGCIRK